jgi:type I restriction enzyme S subunit
MTKAEVKVEKKDGYKKTKLGLIPKQWDVKKLGKLFEFKNGINAGKDAYGKGVKFVNVMDVFGNTFISHDNIIGSVSISEKQLEKNLLQRGDVLFNRTSEIRDEIGMSALYNDSEKAVFGGFVIRGRPKSNKLLPEFSAYGFQLESVRRQIIAKGQGAVRVNIGQGDLEQVYYPIPPKKEQAEIVAVISSWDEAISKTEKLIKAKKRYKKGLMQRLLSGKVRFPEFEGEDWVEVKIGSLLKEVKRMDDWDDKKLYELISVRRRSGGIFPRENLYGHEIKTKKLKKVKTGDFLISRMQIVHGASAVVDPEFEDLYVSNSYHTLVKKSGVELDMNFFDYVSQLPYFYHLTYISSYGVHIEKMTFNLKDFLKKKIKIPRSEAEQHKIASVLQQADKEIDLFKAKKQQFEKQKKGLMQQLLTGKVRVN